MSSLITLVKNKINSYRNESFYKHSKNYLIAEVFNKGLAFLTIPFFTRLLTPEEYGVISIFSTILSIATVLMTLNIQASLVNKYYEKTEEFSYFFGTNYVFIIITNITIIIVSILTSSFVSSAISISTDIYLIAILCSSMTCFIQLELSYLQASQNSKKYVMISVSRNVLLTFIALIWTYYLSKNRYYGIIYAQITTLSLVMIIAIYNITRTVKYKFSLKHIKYSLLFSLPLIPHTLSGVIFSQFDRVMLNKFTGSYDVGIYSLAFNAGLMISVVVAALNNAWIPIFYDLMNSELYDRIETIVIKYSKFVNIVALGLILFSNEIIHIVADERYAQSSKIIPYFAFIGIGNLYYTIFVNYAFYKKKTIYIALISITSCITNVAMNYILIPEYGCMGAVVASLISTLILFILTYINAKHILKVKVVKILSIAKYTAVLILAYVLSIYNPSSSFFIDFITRIVFLVVSIGIICKYK